MEPQVLRAVAVMAVFRQYLDHLLHTRVEAVRAVMKQDQSALAVRAEEVMGALTVPVGMQGFRTRVVEVAAVDQILLAPFEEQAAQVVQVSLS
jgi:hypothetical protein